MISVRRSLSPAGKSFTSCRRVSAVSNWKLQMASLTLRLTAASCEATTANPAPTAISTIMIPMNSARRRLLFQIFSCRIGRPQCRQRWALRGSSALHSRHFMCFSPPYAIGCVRSFRSERDVYYSRFMPGAQVGKQEKHRNPVRTPLRNRQETRFSPLCMPLGGCGSLTLRIMRVKCK